MFRKQRINKHLFRCLRILVEVSAKASKHQPTDTRQVSTHLGET
jgi:hypothetical protein